MLHILWNRCTFYVVDILGEINMQRLLSTALGMDSIKSSYIIGNFILTETSKKIHER